MARKVQGRGAQEGVSDGVAGHVIYTPVPLHVVLDKIRTVPIPFAQIEAFAVAQALGTQAQAAGGPVELLQGLQAGGPVHLCLHGTYEPFDPLQSFLGLGQADKTLPFWLLQGTEVQGDVSLSACQAMLVGSAARSPWAGPGGNRAAAARTRRTQRRWTAGQEQRTRILDLLRTVVPGSTRIASRAGVGLGAAAAARDDVG